MESQVEVHVGGWRLNVDVGVGVRNGLYLKDMLCFSVCALGKAWQGQGKGMAKQAKSRCTLGTLNDSIDKVPITLLHLPGVPSRA